MSGSQTAANNTCNVPNKDPPPIDPPTNCDKQNETASNDEQVKSMDVWFTGKAMASPNSHHQSTPNLQTSPESYPEANLKYSIWKCPCPNYHQYSTNITPGYPPGPQRPMNYPNADLYPPKQGNTPNRSYLSEPHRPMDYPNPSYFPNHKSNAGYPLFFKQSITNLPNPSYQSNPKRVTDYPNPDLYSQNYRTNFGYSPNPQRTMNYPNPDLYAQNYRTNFDYSPNAQRTMNYPVSGFAPNSQRSMEYPNTGFSPNPQKAMGYSHSYFHSPNYQRGEHFVDQSFPSEARQAAMNVPNPDFSLSPYRLMDDTNSCFCPSNYQRQANCFGMNCPAGARQAMVDMPNPDFPQRPMDHPNPYLYPPNYHRQANGLDMNYPIGVKPAMVDMHNPLNPQKPVDYHRQPDFPDNYEQTFGFIHAYENSQRPLKNEPQMPYNRPQELNFAQVPQAYQRFQQPIYCQHKCQMQEPTFPFKFHYNASTSTEDMLTLDESSGVSFDCNLIGKIFYTEKMKPLERDDTRGLNLHVADISDALAMEGTMSQDARRLILSKPPQKPANEHAANALDEEKIEETTSHQNPEKNERPVKTCKKGRSRKKVRYNNKSCSSSQSVSTESSSSDRS